MKQTGLLPILFAMMAAGIVFGRDAGSGRSWEETIRAADNMLQRGHFEQALHILTLTLSEVAKVESSGPRTIVTMNNLGIACQALGRYAEAEAWYCKALRLLEKNRQHAPEDQIRQLNNLTSLYLLMGLYDKAQKVQSRILKHQGRTPGPVHPDTARQYQIAATIARVRRRPAEAEMWCRRGLAAWRSLAGPSHPEIAAILNNLGVIYLDRKDYVRALDHFIESVKMWEQTSGGEHPGLTEPLLNLGRTYVLRQEPDLAEKALARALTIAEGTVGGNHALMARILNEKARALRLRGKVLHAAEFEKRARTILEAQTSEPRSTHTVDVSVLLMEGSE